MAGVWTKAPNSSANPFHPLFPFCLVLQSTGIAFTLSRFGLHALTDFPFFIVLLFVLHHFFCFFGLVVPCRGQVLGRPTLTLTELRAIPRLLAELEAQEGLLVRVWGLFSLVNVLWLLAILGITISILPVLV